MVHPATALDCQQHNRSEAVLKLGEAGLLRFSRPPNPRKTGIESSPNALKLFPNPAIVNLATDSQNNC
jgi:hypothetical protein